MYVMIQDKDSKTKNWAKYFYDTKLYEMDGSDVLIPFHIIRQLLRRRSRPKAVVLRYLNDSKSFIKSFVKFLSSIITFILIKALRIRLIWICHNVDKESKEYYPFMVKVKRGLLEKYADKILVTDKNLIMHATHYLNRKKTDIDYITFGKPVEIDKKNIDKKTQQEIINFVKSSGKEYLIGIAIGNPNDKVLHPFYTDQLIKMAEKINKPIKIILGGPLGDFIKAKDKDTYQRLITNPNILFLDKKVNINEEYIAKYIDFYWRVYDDYSVPFSVYNAVYLNKPLLTMNKGFLQEMVSKYGLGAVIEDDMSNLSMSLEILGRNRTNEFQKFRATHNWEFGAKRLYHVITKSS